MTEKRGINKVFQDSKHLFLSNFLGGIAWGLGTVIGATIVAGLLALIIHLLGGIPFIGKWMAEIKVAVDEAYFAIPK